MLQRLRFRQESPLRESVANIGDHRRHWGERLLIICDKIDRAVKDHHIIQDSVAFVGVSLILLLNGEVAPYLARVSQPLSAVYSPPIPEVLGRL